MLVHNTCESRNMILSTLTRLFDAILYPLHVFMIYFKVDMFNVYDPLHVFMIY